MFKDNRTHEEADMEYVRACGQQCPYCGSKVAAEREVDIDGVYASQEAWCSVCHKQWTDMYKLIGFNPIA